MKHHGHEAEMRLSFSWLTAQGRWSNSPASTGPSGNRKGIHRSSWIVRALACSHEVRNPATPTKSAVGSANNDLAAVL